MTKTAPVPARRWARSLLATLFTLPAGLALAQTPATAPPTCEAAEHRQFDFWIGDWEVFLPSGQKAGENRVDSINAGCSLLENWSGRGGYTGKSLNIYDRTDKRWHQVWVDSTGGVLMLAGGFADKRMVLESGPVAGGSGAPVIHRIAWSINEDASVRQLWESSSDAGKTWTVQFDGKYVRRR